MQSMCASLVKQRERERKRKREKEGDDIEVVLLPVMILSSIDGIFSASLDARLISEIRTDSYVLS